MMCTFDTVHERRAKFNTRRIWLEYYTITDVVLLHYTVYKTKQNKENKKTENGQLLMQGRPTRWAWYNDIVLLYNKCLTLCMSDPHITHGTWLTSASMC